MSVIRTWVCRASSRAQATPAKPPPTTTTCLLTRSGFMDGLLVRASRGPALGVNARVPGPGCRTGFAEGASLTALDGAYPASPAGRDALRTAGRRPLRRAGRHAPLALELYFPRL